MSASLAEVKAAATSTCDTDKNGFKSEDDSRFKFARLGAIAVED